MDTPTPQELIVERDLWVPARDGVRLATDVYRPTSGGPFPVLLERTPYNKSTPSRSERTAAVAASRSRARSLITSRGTAMPSSIRIAAAGTGRRAASQNI